MGLEKLCKSIARLPGGVDEGDDAMWKGGDALEKEIWEGRQADAGVRG